MREVPLTGSVRVIWPFLVALNDDRSWTEAACARLGVSEAQLRDPETRVPLQPAGGLLDDAIRISGRADLGLLAGMAFDARLVGVDELLARTRPTLRALLEQRGRYLPLLMDGARYAFEVRGDRAHVILRLPSMFDHRPAVYEAALAASVLRLRRITGDPTFAPLEIHFIHPPPADTSRHEALFQAPLNFGAPVTQLIFPTRILDQPLPDVDPSLQSVLEQRANAMLARLPHAPGYADQVLALADCELRTISADHISTRLGVSERTLHRRLAAEGTSYRELIERARKSAALRFLEQPRSLEEVADLLGYASTQSFQRAFRRWTGTSPGSYQRQHTRRTG